ncbi:MAG: phosphodiesterase [Clostridia bacterium]|nr:phosphodiesterase [Clostridia bacterium]
MKLFIVSDLHGSAEYCRQMIDAFVNEDADKLLILGDVLYHGPRNELPEVYSPKAVVAMLDTVKEKIICVSGNCDAEIDKDLLPFPVLSDLGAIFVDGINIYFAHGHKPEPILSKGDVYLTGHTHVQLNTIENGHYHLNPGSVSIPKENSKQGYIVYEDKKFTFKDLNGEVFDEVEIKEIAEEAEEEPTKEEAKAPVVKRPQMVRRKIMVRRK